MFPSFSIVNDWLIDWEMQKRCALAINTVAFTLALFRVLHFESKSVILIRRVGPLSKLFMGEASGGLKSLRKAIFYLFSATHWMMLQETAPPYSLQSLDTLLRPNNSYCYCIINFKHFKLRWAGHIFNIFNVRIFILYLSFGLPMLY